MKVLQLEGESAQLRQVARAFAVGDISREDYRHIRTAIIDAFVADNDGVTLTLSDSAPASAVESARDSAAASTDAGWSLLAIVGAGAMLLIVAMLAILLA